MDARTRLLRCAKTACRGLSANARRANLPDADDNARRTVVAAVAEALGAADFADQLMAGTTRVGGAEAILDSLARSVRDSLVESGTATDGHAAELIAGVHEALASPSGVGVHYTPGAVARFMAASAVVEFMVATCGVDRGVASEIVRGDLQEGLNTCDAKRILRRLRRIDICDPACGAGHLLVAMAECLARAEARLCHAAGITEARTTAVLQRIVSQLYGSDVDADAIAIARLRLAAWTGVDLASNEAETIAAGVQVCDGLAGDDSISPLPGGFDIVIMNPPYVPTYSRQSRRDLREPIRRFASARRLSGRLNLFGCFIVRALELAKADGVLSLIVPDTFASATAYADLRRSCRARFSRQMWVRIDDRVFKAQVGSVILTCSRGVDSIGAASVDFDPSDVSTGQRSRATPLLADFGEDDRILFFENEDERRIWQQVRAVGTATLDAIATIRDGVNTGPRRMRDLLLDPARPSIDRRPLIEGGDIAPRGYLLDEPSRTIRYDATMLDAAARAAGASLRDPAIFESPKVVTRQTADTIIAALEPAGGIVALNSVHCICLPASDRHLLPGVMAFLNSPLVRLFYALDGGEQRAVLPQVRIAWLRKLPLPPDARDVFEMLAPIGNDVINRLRREADVHQPLASIHRLVCEAYGFGDRSHDVSYAAYLGRFPRFGEATQPRRRRNASRVA